jgi:hypothetical protein
LSCLAIALSLAWPCRDRSVPRGRYWCESLPSLAPFRRRLLTLPYCPITVSAEWLSKQAPGYRRMAEPYTTPVLRGGAGHQCADRDRGAAPDWRTLCHRGRCSRSIACHRLAARHGRSKPVIDALRIWFEAQLPLVPGHSTLAEAIRYALSRWNGLTRFLDDGRIELDTDPVERAIRPIALGEKIISSRGATAAAIVRPCCVR